MKQKNYKILTVALFSFMAVSSSCLKDTRYVPFENSPNLIEFPVTAFSGVLESAAFSISNTPSDLPVLINLASPTPSNSSITVKFVVDAAALTAYNKANGTSYQLLPSADFSTNLQAVIPAGKREANLNVSINSSLIDLSQQYALPITISDPGTGNVISANYKTIIYSIGIKNQYDGVYTMKGYVLRAGDNVLSGYFSNISQTLSTVGSDGVTGLTQVWSGGSGVAGVSPINLTVDPSTNKVTVTSAINATLTGDPAYDNRYDPASKTFYVSFYWNAGKTSRDATDTLIYSGPRQ